MQTITTIGLDIAKSVFQVHGVDAAGVPCRRMVSSPPSRTGFGPPGSSVRPDERCAIRASGRPWFFKVSASLKRRRAGGLWIDAFLGAGAFCGRRLLRAQQLEWPIAHPREFLRGEVLRRCE
jgi:hypothetical protein